MASAFLVGEELALAILQQMVDVVLHVHITGRYREEDRVLEGKRALGDEIAQGLLRQHRCCIF
jgi:hypothetical protein